MAIEKQSSQDFNLFVVRYCLAACRGISENKAGFELCWMKNSTLMQDEKK